MGEEVREDSVEAMLERMGFTSRMANAKVVVADFGTAISETDVCRWCRDAADAVEHGFDTSVRLSQAGDEEGAERVAEQASRERMDGSEAVCDFAMACPGYLDRSTIEYMADKGFVEEHVAKALGAYAREDAPVEKEAVDDGIATSIVSERSLDV